jgi:hypothetical protein
MLFPFPAIEKVFFFFLNQQWWALQLSSGDEYAIVASKKVEILVVWDLLNETWCRRVRKFQGCLLIPRRTFQTYITSYTRANVNNVLMQNL